MSNDIGSHDPQNAGQPRPPWAWLLDEKEAVFRQRLTFLIQGYDDAHASDDEDTDAERDWDRDWEDFLCDLTDDRSRRAFDVLQLHIQNRHAHD